MKYLILSLFLAGFLASSSFADLGAPQGIWGGFVEIPKVPISPLKQFKSGVPAEEIACKEGQTVMLKKNTNIPLCIKNSSITELYCRNFLDDVWNASHPICDKVVLNSATKSPTDYREMKVLSVSPENVTLPDPKPKAPARSGGLTQE